MSYIALIAAQLLYSVSDLWKKTLFTAKGFNFSAFTHPAFLTALAVATIGYFFQLYALSKIDLSRMAVVIGMMAVIFSSAAGIIFLKETFNFWNWLGMAAALLAIFLVHVR